MTKRVLGLISALLLMLLPGLAFADAAGTAKGVDPQADALRGPPPLSAKMNLVPPRSIGRVTATSPTAAPMAIH